MTENNNIVTKVLAIAKKRESARLKKIEDALFKYLQYKFDTFLDGCHNWLAVEGKLFYYANLSDLKINNISKHDLETAGKNIGLKIQLKKNSDFTFQIITTKDMNGYILSPAQKMLQDFNANLLERINLQYSLAENICKTILDMLNTGDFASEKDIQNKKWLIIVTNSSIPNKQTSYFYKRADEILNKNGFHLEHFTANSRCKLSIPFEEDIN